MTRNECVSFLRTHDSYLILSHRRPDGDALGSAAGLCRGLRALGKTAAVLPNPEITERYVPYLREYEAGPDYRYDTVVTVDLAEEGIIQLNGEDHRGKIALSIDHHPSNKGYAGETYLRAEAASCGEIVYDILIDLLGSIDRETATLLYIAVTTDTGCFRYKNTTPDTLRTGALLLEAGAPIDLNRTVFMKKRRSRLKMESAIIDSLEFFHGDEASIGTVTLADRARCGVTEADMEDIASVSGQVEGVELSITLRENENGQWKISVRTGQYGNANAVCAEFGGGGHGMAAGCTMEGSMEDVKARLRAAVEKHWGENPV